MKILRSHKMSLTAAVIGVLVVIGLAIGYGWVLLEVRDVLDNVELLAEESQLLASKNTHTHSVRRVVRDTQELRGELSTYFIGDDELVPFLENLEELGTHVGAALVVQSVRVGETLDSDALIEQLKLSLKVDGSFQEVYYVLSLLEAFPKALSIDNVHLLQHPTEGSWQGTFDISVVRMKVEEG